MHRTHDYNACQMDHIELPAWQGPHLPEVCPGDTLLTAKLARCLNGHGNSCQALSAASKRSTRTFTIMTREFVSYVRASPPCAEALAKHGVKGSRSLSDTHPLHTTCLCSGVIQHVVLKSSSFKPSHAHGNPDVDGER